MLLLLLLLLLLCAAAADEQETNKMKAAASGSPFAAFINQPTDRPTINTLLTAAAAAPLDSTKMMKSVSTVLHCAALRVRKREEVG